MSNPIWQRYPAATKVRCVKMKDRAQERIRAETRDATPDQLLTYFREASRRFWIEAGRGGSEGGAKPRRAHRLSVRAS